MKVLNTSKMLQKWWSITLLLKFNLKIQKIFPLQFNLRADSAI